MARKMLLRRITTIDITSKVLEVIITMANELTCILTLQNTRVKFEQRPYNSSTLSSGVLSTTKKKELSFLISS
jgi:hypothetical protein